MGGTVRLPEYKDANAPIVLPVGAFFMSTERRRPILGFYGVLPSVLNLGPEGLSAVAIYVRSQGAITGNSRSST